MYARRYLVSLASSWASWWAKCGWVESTVVLWESSPYLRVKQYRGELLVCDSGYYSKWVLTVYWRVVGEFFWWCGGCHPASHVGDLVFLRVTSCVLPTIVRSAVSSTISRYRMSANRCWTPHFSKNILQHGILKLANNNCAFRVTIYRYSCVLDWVVFVTKLVKELREWSWTLSVS